MHNCMLYQLGLRLKLCLISQCRQSPRSLEGRGWKGGAGREGKGSRFGEGERMGRVVRGKGRGWDGTGREPYQYFFFPTSSAGTNVASMCCLAFTGVKPWN